MELIIHLEQDYLLTPEEIKEGYAVEICEEAGFPEFQLKTPTGERIFMFGPNVISLLRCEASDLVRLDKEIKEAERVEESVC